VCVVWSGQPSILLTEWGNSVSLLRRVQILEEWVGDSTAGAWTDEDIRNFAYVMGVPEEGMIRVIQEVVPTRQMSTKRPEDLTDALERAYPEISQDFDGIAARLEESRAKRKPVRDTTPHLTELRKYLKRTQRPTQ